MILSILIIAAIGLIAYLWSAQGLFSALLHFACVLVAGAIAFAVWEPLVYNVLLGIGALQEYAWGLGLLLPFLVSLLVLRIACDKLIPGNLDLDDTTNFVGGLAFGALAGLVTAGIVLVGVGFFRLPSAIMGYKPMQYDANGNIVRGSSLLLPADRIVVGFYEMLSQGALATSRPLATLAPVLHEQSTLVRFTVGDKGRTTIHPDDFSLLGRYRVEASNISDLLSDTFSVGSDGRPIPQQARDSEEQSFPSGSRIEGFVLQFNSGAREKNGQFVASPGHFRLIAQNDAGETRALHPIAVVSQGEAWALDIYRWRFDASEVFIASVGGGSSNVMAFEFVVPPGYNAQHLIVRNVRTSLPAALDFEFGSPRDRDAAIRDRSLFERVGATLVAREGSRPDEVQRPMADREPIRRTHRLPGVMNRSARGSLVLDDGNRIIDGQHTFSRDMMNQQGLAEALRVDSFDNGPDTWIVQVDVSMPSRVSLFGRAFDTATQVLPPTLVDNLGQRYEAIGFIHDTGTNITIRFTPGRPIRAMTELPQLSRSRPGERLTLLFRVSARVTVQQFTLGNEVLEDNIGMVIPDPERRR